MKKLSRLLPILILLLALLYLLVPGTENTPAVTAETTEPIAAGDTLSLTDLSEADQEGSGSSQQTSTEAAKPESSPEEDSEQESLLPEDGSYTTKEDVALYLIQYGHLPSNFITKKEAEKAGWTGGSVEQVLPGMCIGGDYFGNYEGLLPKAKGRTWTECDINTLGKKSRGAERLIFSNDGLIYYTDDHYDSFTQLY